MVDTSTIERELYIDASPEVVFDVISNPRHVAQWWSDDAEFSSTAGEPGWISFGDVTEGGKHVQLTVAEAVPYRHFSFRWTHEEGETATPGNSNLVAIDLEPSGDGTRLRFSETGFHDRGWDETETAATHADHVNGWDFFLPRLVTHAERIGSEV